MAKFIAPIAPEYQESAMNELMGFMSPIGFTGIQGFKTLIKSLEQQHKRALVGAEKYNPFLLLRMIMEKFKPEAYEHVLGPYATDSFMAIPRRPNSTLFLDKEIIKKPLTTWERFATGHEFGHHAAANIPEKEYAKVIESIQSVPKKSMLEDIQALKELIGPKEGRFLDRPNYWNYGAPTERPYSELISDFFGGSVLTKNPDLILPNVLPYKDPLLQFFK